MFRCCVYVWLNFRCSFGWWCFFWNLGIRMCNWVLWWRLFLWYRIYYWKLCVFEWVFCIYGFDLFSIWCWFWFLIGGVLWVVDGIVVCWFVFRCYCVCNKWCCVGVCRGVDVFGEVFWVWGCEEGYGWWVLFFYV